MKFRDKMIEYFNNQQRGWRANSITKDKDGNFVFELPLVEPDNPVIVTNNNIFFPYPENDLIQNPKLREEPQPYTFNE